MDLDRDGAFLGKAMHLQREVFPSRAVLPPRKEAAWQDGGLKPVGQKEKEREKEGEKEYRGLELQYSPGRMRKDTARKRRKGDF